MADSIAKSQHAVNVPAQFPFWPWPNRLRSVAKRSRTHAQRKDLASLSLCSGVNSQPYWRQLRRVLTPKRRTGHRRIQGWPHDRSLLDRRRKGLGYASGRVCPLDRKVRGAFPTCRGHPPAQRRHLAVRLVPSSAKRFLIKTATSSAAVFFHYRCPCSCTPCHRLADCWLFFSAPSFLKMITRSSFTSKV